MTEYKQDPDTVDLLLYVKDDLDFRSQKKPRHSKPPLRVTIDPGKRQETKNSNVHLKEAKKNHNSDGLLDTQSGAPETLEKTQKPKEALQNNFPKQNTLESSVYQLYWNLEACERDCRERLQRETEFLLKIAQKRSELAFFVSLPPKALQKHKHLNKTLQFAQHLHYIYLEWINSGVEKQNGVENEKEVVKGMEEKIVLDAPEMKEKGLVNQHECLKTQNLPLSDNIAVTVAPRSTPASKDAQNNCGNIIQQVYAQISRAAGPEAVEAEDNSERPETVKHQLKEINYIDQKTKIVNNPDKETEKCQNTHKTLRNLILEYLEYLREVKRGKYLQFAKARTILCQSIQQCQELMFLSIRNGAKLTQLKLQLRLIQLDLRSYKKTFEADNVSINGNATNQKFIYSDVHEKNSRNNAFNSGNNNQHSLLSNNNLNKLSESTVNKYNGSITNNGNFYLDGQHMINSSINITIYGNDNRYQQIIKRMNQSRYPCRPQITPTFGMQKAPQITKINIRQINTEPETVECQLDPATCEPKIQSTVNNEQVSNELTYSPQFVNTLKLNQKLEENNAKKNISQQLDAQQVSITDMDEEVQTNSDAAQEETHVEAVERITQSNQILQNQVLQQTTDKQHTIFQTEETPSEQQLKFVCITPFFTQSENKEQTIQEFAQLVELTNFATIMKEIDGLKPYNVRCQTNSTDVATFLHVDDTRHFSGLHCCLGSNYMVNNIIMGRNIADGINECKADNQCNETIIFQTLDQLQGANYYCTSFSFRWEQHCTQLYKCVQLLYYLKQLQQQHKGGKVESRRQM